MNFLPYHYEDELRDILPLEKMFEPRVTSFGDVELRSIGYVVEDGVGSYVVVYDKPTGEIRWLWRFDRYILSHQYPPPKDDPILLALTPTFVDRLGSKMITTTIGSMLLNLNVLDELEY